MRVGNSTLSNEGVTGIFVNGNTIQWPSNGWYQVQNLTTLEPICEGGTHCVVDAGTYRVINLSSGSRTEVRVGGQGSQPSHSNSATSSTNSSASNSQSLIDPASYRYNDIYSRSNYELVFSDEFESTSLSPYRWNTGLRWDGENNGGPRVYRVINNEKQLYVNTFSNDQEHIRLITPLHNPFELNGSRLAIRAVRNPLSEIASQQDFLSGVITTHRKFSQKYGYFEARIKIPSHEGSFPAFWLFHENRAWQGTQRTEIDIMENLGHAPWYIYNSFHYYKNVSAQYFQNYHVYAVEWQPDRITWFVDGTPVNTINNDAVNFEALYVTFNLAMGGNWTNFPANLGGLGRTQNQFYPTQNDLINFRNPALEIDYVRVYKRR